MGQKIKRGFWKSLFRLKNLYYLFIATLTTACLDDGSSNSPDPQPLYGVTPDYGMTMATLTIEGKILEGGTTSGVADIEVTAYTLRKSGDTTYAYTSDIDTTDANGNYKVTVYEMVFDSQQVAIHTTDPQDSSSSGYNDKDTTITFYENDLTGGDATWNQGAADTTINIEFEK